MMCESIAQVGACAVLAHPDYSSKLPLFGGLDKARFRKCAVEVLSVEESAVVMDAKFGDDLDADSLDLVELVMALEEEFDIAVPEEDLEGVETVKNAYDLVTGKL